MVPTLVGIASNKTQLCVRFQKGSVATATKDVSLLHYPPHSCHRSCQLKPKEELSTQQAPQASEPLQYTPEMARPHKGLSTPR